MYKILIIGPQGSGKGTQAELLAKALNIPAISMGALLREEIASGSNEGQAAKDYLDKGTLVPDELAIGIIKKRLVQSDAAKGWIIDGFPRVASQMELFLTFAQPTHAVLLELSDEQAVERLAGRLFCPACQQGFHEIYLPPQTPGRCDKCGSELVKRPDDNPVAIRQRLEIYHNETEPLLARYERMGILHRVDGSGTIEEIFASIKKIFN
jgi:adenylate kinase